MVKKSERFVTLSGNHFHNFTKEKTASLKRHDTVAIAIVFLSVQVKYFSQMSCRTLKLYWKQL